MHFPLACFAVYDEIMVFSGLESSETSELISKMLGRSTLLTIPGPLPSRTRHYHCPTLYSVYAFVIWTIDVGQEELKGWCLSCVLLSVVSRSESVEQASVAQ